MKLIISLHGKVCTQQIDLAPNVWLHSSVGRAIRTGIAEVTLSNPVEALIFLRLLPSNCLNWKFTAMITLHLPLIDHRKRIRIVIVKGTKII